MRVEHGLHKRTTWLRIAGVATIGLVWSVTAPEGEVLPGVAAAWIVDAGAALMAFAFLASDLLPVPGARRAGLALQALAALAVVAASPGSSSPILIIVVVAQVLFSFPLRPALALVLALNLLELAILAGVWGLPPVEAVVVVLLYGSFHAFALLIVAYARAADTARTRLREVNAELLATRSLLVEAARDQERLRLSRELHDVAGHTLTALKLNLRQLVAASEGEARASASESLALAEGLLEDVRALVGNFRRTDGFAVDGAIRELAAPFDVPQFEFDLAGGAMPDLELARTLVAVAREAVTNVVRHAGARRCWIALSHDGGRFRLTVEDDGSGTGGAAFGQGLRGMRERLEAVGGALTVAERRGGGTRVEAVVEAAA